MIMVKKALTAGEIAHYCEVTSRTVIQWIKDGKMNAYRTPGNHSRVKREDFIKFLKKYNMPIAEELKTGISKKKVLIVDDDQGMVKMIERILMGEKGYEIDYAFDGFIAGQKYESNKPDLIILDLKMPKVDGYELCRNVRKDPKNDKVKLLVMSGDMDKEIVEKVKSLGADDCLAKPFMPDDLINSIKNLLSS